MKFLNIRRGKKPDGTVTARMYFEEKTQKFGKLVSSKYIKKTQNILISGGYHSGKSRIINKIWRDRREIYGKGVEFIKLSGFGTIAEYVEKPILRDFYNSIPKKRTEKELIDFFNDNEGREFKRLRQHEKIENLILFVKYHKTILVIDDGQKLTNRKLEIVKRCIENCYRFVISTSEEQRLSTALRTMVIGSDTQHIRLNTKASYDATAIFIYFLIAVCAVGGWYEMALITGALKALSSGRGASRKD